MRSYHAASKWFFRFRALRATVWVALALVLSLVWNPLWAQTPGFAYVANFIDNTVSAYTVNSTTGALTPVSGSPFATGSHPQSVAVSPNGQFAYVVNGSDGNVSAYTINATTGALTPVSGSPFGPANPAYPGASSVAVSPNGQFAYVANAAYNIVFAYTINATTGALTPVSGSPFATGAIPVSVAVSPNGQFAYVVNEGDNTVSAYAVKATTGALTPLSGSPFAAGTYPISVAVSANGQFAYVANSGSNNVSAYTIDATTGALTPVSGSPFAAGRSPYSMAVSASGPFAYVVNEADGNVSAYTIDATTGALTPVSGSPFSAASAPFSVAVSANGQFAYIALAGSNNVAAYTINATTGALMPVSGSPFATGAIPVSVAVTFSTVPFAKFGATLYLAPKLSAFAANETFTLGATSTGITPPTQVVTLTIGALTLNLPAGSFVADQQPRKGYVYRGKVNGVDLFVDIYPTSTPQAYGLFVLGAGYAFPAGGSSMPVAMSIGDNSGSGNLTPHYVKLPPTSP